MAQDFGTTASLAAWDQFRVDGSEWKVFWLTFNDFRYHLENWQASTPKIAKVNSCFLTLFYLAGTPSCIVYFVSFSRTPFCPTPRCQAFCEVKHLTYSLLEACLNPQRGCRIQTSDVYSTDRAGFGEGDPERLPLGLVVRILVVILLLLLFVSHESWPCTPFEATRKRVILSLGPRPTPSHSSPPQPADPWTAHLIHSDLPSWPWPGYVTLWQAWAIKIRYTFIFGTARAIKCSNWEITVCLIPAYFKWNTNQGVLCVSSVSSCSASSMFFDSLTLGLLASVYR